MEFVDGRIKIHRPFQWMGYGTLQVTLEGNVVDFPRQMDLGYLFETVGAEGNDSPDYGVFGIYCYVSLYRTPGVLSTRLIADWLQSEVWPGFAIPEPLSPSGQSLASYVPNWLQAGYAPPGPYDTHVQLTGDGEGYDDVETHSGFLSVTIGAGAFDIWQPPSRDYTFYMAGGGATSELFWTNKVRTTERVLT